MWVGWPFPAPGADPVADLIAMHSPRLHAAIRAWHNLAPALAVVGAWSVAVSLGLVWLAGGGRRPAAGVLPPSPLSRSDAVPAVVVGEVHHPVKEPFWQQAYVNLVRWLIELHRMAPARWASPATASRSGWPTS